ncbi:type II toxin-antitoxin system YhaV family toxin [Endozoicomonas sp.]|uniref:type II toxin-antitoxin system YhaV family toxin n=1 Tax=Endozoicomonas sp. TaxID=1892382 RepID=UPI002884AD8A|nr:type II toxin-antitoxin system YhaV family toxin [Endozoicomonas sp.]
MSEQTGIVINGWTIFAHPLFLDEIDTLLKQVNLLKTNDPVHYFKKNAFKRLAAIARLAFEVIPEDPTILGYRQGSTLGDHHKHWFRAKFFQQYRLFFRFDSSSKIIVYAWVNDEKKKRSYGKKTDAYRVFEKILGSGYPPDNWNQLLSEARGSLNRLNDIINDF